VSRLGKARLTPGPRGIDDGFNGEGWQKVTTPMSFPQ
jgi:hypothetical protein